MLWEQSTGAGPCQHLLCATEKTNSFFIFCLQSSTASVQVTAPDTINDTEQQQEIKSNNLQRNPELSFPPQAVEAFPSQGKPGICRSVKQPKPPNPSSGDPFSHSLGAEDKLFLWPSEATIQERDLAPTAVSKGIQDESKLPLHFRDQGKLLISFAPTSIKSFQMTAQRRFQRATIEYFSCKELHLCLE